MDNTNERRSKLDLRLKDVLKEKGITQSELAERIGKPFSMVNQIATGKRGVSAGILLDIADALGVHMEDLVEGRGEPSSEDDGLNVLAEYQGRFMKARTKEEFRRMAEVILGSLQ